MVDKSEFISQVGVGRRRRVGRIFGAKSVDVNFYDDRPRLQEGPLLRPEIIARHVHSNHATYHTLHASALLSASSPDCPTDMGAMKKTPFQIRPSHPSSLLSPPLVSPSIYTPMSKNLRALFEGGEEEGGLPCVVVA